MSELVGETAAAAVPHPAADSLDVDASGWRISTLEDGSGVALTGEFDLVNRRQLEIVLDQLTATGRDVSVEMAGVTFADLGTVTTLALAAQSLPPGQRLILHRPPRTVRRVLDLCWRDLDRVEVTT